MTYTLCSHEWSFLEGEKKRSHTLKAGRHLFPFQLHVGGSLPSTLYTDAYGGASVEYKLRAIATRPGFAHNLHTQRVVTLLRSFGPEAIEYQQSLEIENTWPEKLMYSIMIPHKAWPAGDNLTAVVKFSPLAKGVRVLSVVTTLNETIKTFTRTGRQESTKTLIEVKHEFRNGQAVRVVHQDQEQDHSPRSRSRAHSGPTTPSTPLLQNTDHPQRSPPSSGHATSFIPTSHSGEPLPTHLLEGGPSTSTQPPLPQTGTGSGTHPVPLAVGFELSEGDIATKLDISLPVFTTPTHPLEPIIASHRIRWNILIGNLDGHTSELRCSLPLHILDGRLFDEATSATAATRQLLLGGPEVPEEQDPDTVLPSYPSHIRDRVANVYLPDQAALRVTNPWLQHGIRPVQQHRDDADPDGRLSSPTSGTHTPLEAYYVPSSAQHGGDPGLEYVNSELLLSLSQNAPPSSRPGSSRASRAPSPEREPHSRRLSNAGGSSSSSGGGQGQGQGQDLGASTFVHENSSASRNLHGVFHATMKPLTSLSSSVIPTRYHPNAHHPHPHPHSPQHHPQHHPHPSSQLPRTVPVTSHSQLHRVFTEVPDYGISSRGFLGGGVTPLETLQGLPSYEEAEMQRSRSESDLAAMAQPLRLQPLRRLVATTGPPSPSPTLPLS